MKKYIGILLLALLTGCGTGEKFSEYFEVPPELKDQAAKQKTYDIYSPYLQNIKIFIDPGHGGAERGARGLIMEAEANLRVALALRDFLKEGGAKVIMSRVKDTSVNLAERSKLANNSGCDIFISVHHNAAGSRDDKTTNYTSTYYHALETDYEHNDCNRDMARYIQRDLAFSTRNSGGLGSFDGTYSDYIIYPKAGFSVLRLTEIPAVLVEVSFIGARLEEQRVANEAYNRIEGWGIFKGLCKYLKAGVPEIKQAGGDTISKTGNFIFTLKDASGINEKSIQVKVDSSDIKFSYEQAAKTITVNADVVGLGEHEIKITAANNNGNHNFPFRKKIHVTE
jgi:N-acetylmuramoyl-L-alanine amidase